MARRSPTKGEGLGYAVILAIASPGIIAFKWPLLGWLIILTSVVGFVGWLRARWLSHKGGTWPEWLPRSNAVPLLAVWLAPVAYGGLNCGTEWDEREARAQAQKAADTQEEQRRAYAREAAARERMRLADEREQAEQREVQSFVARPALAQLHEAGLRIKVSEDSALDAAVCHAQRLAARLSPEEARSKEGRAFTRQTEQARRGILAVLRRDAMAYRGLLCSDGSSSPSCSCAGSHQGCCSHHGGVAGCEPAEPVEFACPEMDEREDAIENRNALARPHR
jgi:hypothetical protein